ncbi:MAG: tyrosine-protein phosphatase, partial [Proteobacteria bacterium]|nr:tyrosine-protein phosphatase [Pseudomonadota bacterium]
KTSDLTEESGRKFMTDTYARMVLDPAHIDLFSRYFEVLAEQDRAVLIHCAAGKDRTGVLAALILLLLGVPRESVLADYLKTSQQRGTAQLEADLALQLEAVLGQTPVPEMVKVIAGVREIYLDSAIEAVTARHGSVESYFVGAGVGREQVREFRSRLIE